MSRAHWSQWSALFEREERENNHGGSGPHVAEAGDTRVLKKQGEAFIQPKTSASEWSISRELAQNWTAKLGLVNLTDHLLVTSSGEMEAPERFSKFAEAWKTPAKRGRSGPPLPDWTLPGPEDDFSFVKSAPNDPSALMTQLERDPAKVSV